MGEEHGDALTGPGLRPFGAGPQASQAKPLVPIAKGNHVTYWPNVAVVQPLLEPDPSAVRKVGNYAAFAYWRWSCLAVGFDLMPGGLAIHLGPLMFGAVKIQTFERYAQGMETRRAETERLGAEHDSAVAESDAPVACDPRDSTEVVR